MVRVHDRFPSVLTLKSLFAIHPHSTAAGLPICGPVPEQSGEGGVGGGMKSWLHTDVWLQTVFARGSADTRPPSIVAIN